MNAIIQHRILQSLRPSRVFMAAATLFLAGIHSAVGQYMPGETDPVASGFYLSTGNRWFKEGKAVTPSNVSEFRVIDGKPYWRAGNQYHYNSMDNFTETDWGFRGPCTVSGATCFFVSAREDVFYRIGSTYYYNSLSMYDFGTSSWGYNGLCSQSEALDFRVIGRKAFYRIGSTYYYNSLLGYDIGTGAWGDNGVCTQSGALDFQVFDGGVFYRIGSTYYYNSLSTFPFNTGDWGLNGVCTQSGAANFRVSNRKPYWTLFGSVYRNSLGVFSSSPNTWSEITIVAGPLPEPDAPDPAYDPCAYPYRSPPSAPTDINLSNATILENQPVGTVVGTLSTTDANMGDTFTYTLVAGAGSTDNAAFTINGSTLETAVSFDYEATSNLTIRVRSTDRDALWYEKAFTITVLAEVEPPFRILGISGDPVSGITIRWSSEAGYSYQVQSSDTLRDGDWQNIGSAQTAESGELELSHTDTSGSAGDYLFYRVVRTAAP